MIRNILFISVATIFLILSIIALAGMYKFNVLQDDIYILGTAIEKGDIVGSWVQPIPGSAKEYQGFKLNEDGTASSINISTLLYKNWEISNGVLTIKYESNGNETPCSGEISYPIYTVGKYDLALMNGEIFRKK